MFYVHLKPMLLSKYMFIFQSTFHFTYINAIFVLICTLIMIILFSNYKKINAGCTCFFILNNKMNVSIFKKMFWKCFSVISVNTFLLLHVCLIYTSNCADKSYLIGLDCFFHTDYFYKHFLHWNLKFIYL